VSADQEFYRFLAIVMLCVLIGCVLAVAHLLTKGGDR